MLTKSHQIIHFIYHWVSAMRQTEMYYILSNTLLPSYFPLTWCKFNLFSERGTEAHRYRNGVFDQGHTTSSNTDNCHLNASLMMPNQMLFTHNSCSIMCTLFTYKRKKKGSLYNIESWTISKSTWGLQA